MLGIGEFAAATQLTPKALRLYDEQGLLRPARIDATNGYRYYSSSQAAAGRLIRVLRDMDLPLAAIGEIISLDSARAEMLLRQHAHEIDRRFAREKQALHSALRLLRGAPGGDALHVSERELPAMTVLVTPFAAARHDFFERYSATLGQTRETASHAGLSPRADAYCALIEPLSDDEGRLEALLPIDSPVDVPGGTTVRTLRAASYAVVTAESQRERGLDLTAEFDALFDWFDRRGLTPCDDPLLACVLSDDEVHAEILWASRMNPR